MFDGEVFDAEYVVLEDVAEPLTAWMLTAAYVNDPLIPQDCAHSRAFGLRGGGAAD